MQIVWLSILPPLITIACAVLSKNILHSLFIAAPSVTYFIGEGWAASSLIMPFAVFLRNYYIYYLACSDPGLMGASITILLCGISWMASFDSTSISSIFTA